LAGKDKKNWGTGFGVPGLGKRAMSNGTTWKALGDARLLVTFFQNQVFYITMSQKTARMGNVL